MDSVKTQYGQVLLVDAGGFFPEQTDEVYQNTAWFMMDVMRLLGTDAAGISDKELRFGKGFLLANVKRSGLPVVCANLWDKQTKTIPISATFAPKIVIKGGTATDANPGLADVTGVPRALSWPAMSA